MFKLTIAGSGDAFGSGGRLSTCFHVETPSGNFLIDCGAGSISGLKKNDIKLADIDTIILSHFHGDHYGGLPFFLLEAAVYKRDRLLTIISPPGCKERVDGLLRLLYPGSEVLEKLNIRFLEYEPGKTLRADYLEVQAFPVIHTEETLPHGLRISTGGKVISYSGDTAWTETLIELSRNADLFICECNFFALNIKGHLSYRVLKEKIPLLSCGRILLTHFDEEMLRNMQHVEVECACDGLVTRI